MASTAPSVLPDYGTNVPSGVLSAMAQPQVMPPVQSPTNPGQGSNPSFSDIANNLKNPIQINGNQPIAGSSTFEKGVAASAPSAGISPETQAILDIIRKNQDYATGVGVANASSLAAKRGITGSSTEMFGANEAVGQASRAAQDSTVAALNNDFQAQQQLKQLQAKGYFDRASQEGSVGAQLGINTANLTADQQKTLATLTSDEIASLRNMDFQSRTLALQQLLGQQSIESANANINASKDIAKQGSQYALAGGVLAGATPYLLNRFLPAAGASAVTGGGAASLASAALPAGVSGAGAGGIPLASAGGAAPAAGIGIGGAAAIAGAGLGAMALDKYANSKLDLSGRFGNTGGAVARTLLNPIGAPLNLAKDIVSNPKQALTHIADTVSQATSKVFGGGNTSDGNYIAGVSRGVLSQLDQIRALKKQLTAGQISQSQYEQAAAPLAVAAGQQVSSLAGQGSTQASAINPLWQQAQNDGLITAQNGRWVLGSGANALELSNANGWNNFAAAA